MRSSTWVSVFVLVGYLAVSHAVYNLYPFSTFSMYATSRLDTGSRVIALDHRGHPRELRRYHNFVCDGPAELDPPTCPNRHIPYLTEELRQYILEHRGDPGSPGSEQLEVVQRVWRFTADGTLDAIEDCPVLTCTAEFVP